MPNARSLVCLGVAAALVPLFAIAELDCSSGTSPPAPPERDASASDATSDGTAPEASVDAAPDATRDSGSDAGADSGADGAAGPFQSCRTRRPRDEQLRKRWRRELLYEPRSDRRNVLPDLRELGRQRDEAKRTPRA